MKDGQFLSEAIVTAGLRLISCKFLSVTFEQRLAHQLKPFVMRFRLVQGYGLSFRVKGHILDALIAVRNSGCFYTERGQSPCKWNLQNVFGAVQISSIGTI